MALDERDFFTQKPENRSERYQCPRCQRSGDYNIRWVRHAKKDRMPSGSDGGDRAKFEKLRDYLLRLDDSITCKVCSKRFDIPSQQSLMFIDQLGGLPNEAELEREISAAAEETLPETKSKPKLPTRFTRKSSGWK
jgi:hypothetical protein